MVRTFLCATALFTLALLMSGDRPRQVIAVWPAPTAALLFPGAPDSKVQAIPLIVPRDGWSIQLVVRDSRDESPPAPYLGCGAPCLTPHLPAELR